MWRDKKNVIQGIFREEKVVIVADKHVGKVNTDDKEVGLVRTIIV